MRKTRAVKHKTSIRKEIMKNFTDTNKIKNRKSMKLKAFL